MTTTGERLKLKSVKVGGRRYIKRADLADFIAACNAADRSGADNRQAVADSLRTAEEAGRALEELGA